MKRSSGDLAVGVGGNMIRLEEEEGEDLDDDNAMDDDEEEDEDDVDETGSSNQEEPVSDDHGAAGQSNTHRHRHQQQQQQQQEPSLPSALLAPSSSDPSGRRLGRRASSAVFAYGNTSPGSAPVTSTLPAAGDKGLRPHFLKERSATIMDMAGGKGRRSGIGGRVNGDAAAGSPPAPQSKASTFLMSVLAKSRALNSGGPYGLNGGLGDMLAGGAVLNSSHSLRPTITNSIHYAHLGKDQGQRLRSPMSRRARRMLSSLAHEWGDHHQLAEGSTREEGGSVDEGGDDEGLRSLRQQADTPAEMVAELRRHRQQLPEQLAVLTRIHRRLEEFDVVDEEEHLLLCAAFVDAGLLVEAAAVMREFRFNAYFHICVANVLTVLAGASSLYAYMMAELGVESILQKAVAVHATHERLVMMASALLHAMEESKTATNVQVVHNVKTVTEKQRATYFADLVHAQLGLPSKNASPKKCSAAKSSPKVDSRLAVPPRHSGSKSEANATTRPVVPPLFGKRAISSSHSASRLRQLLTERLAPPPKLSAHYDLVFAKSSSSMLPSPFVAPLADGGDAPRPQPATSPTKQSVSIDLKLLSSSQSAATAYGDSVLFVEPSSLHKRLPLRRGSHSASGVPRRLSARRHSGKRLDSLTPRAFSSGSMDVSNSLDDSGMRFTSTANDRVGETGLALPVASPVASLSAFSTAVKDERSPNDGATSATHAALPFEDQKDVDAAISQGERSPEVPKGEDKDDEDDEYDDESYDDDFSPADDVGEAQAQGDKKEGWNDDCLVLSGQLELARVESDNELIDILADLALHEPDVSSQRIDGSGTQEALGQITYVPVTTPRHVIEVAAATCIQRHVRGMSTRRRMMAERGTKARTRSKTEYEPRNTLLAPKLRQVKTQSRARTRSLAMGATQSASLKRPVSSHAAGPLRSRSRSPSPVPAPSGSSASPSLVSNLPTRKVRSVSVAAHRPLFQPSIPSVKKSTSLSGGNTRAFSSAPRANVSTAGFDVRPTTTDTDTARGDVRQEGISSLKHDPTSTCRSSDAVASASPNADASPSSAVAAVEADALFGGPDPLRRLQDLYAEGLRLHHAGQIAEAAASYEAALALAPTTGRDFASVHLNLGSARMALGDAAAALEAFREAHRVQPASAKAAFNEALALLRLGWTREATRMLREVLRLEPTHRRAHEALAHVEGEATPNSHSHIIGRPLHEHEHGE